MQYRKCVKFKRATRITKCVKFRGASMEAVLKVAGKYAVLKLQYHMKCTWLLTITYTHSICRVRLVHSHRIIVQWLQIYFTLWIRDKTTWKIKTSFLPDVTRVFPDRLDILPCVLWPFTTGWWVPGKAKSKSLRTDIKSIVPFAWQHRWYGKKYRHLFAFKIIVMPRNEWIYFNSSKGL